MIYSSVYYIRPYYTMEYTDVDDMIDSFTSINVETPENNELINYIYTLAIDENIKNYLCKLIQNDCVTDYSTIYNICCENDIELPPF